VQAVPGHTVPVSAQVLIGAWCAVTADHVDFSVRTSQGNHQIAEQVKEPRIVFVNLTIPVVTQILIDPRQSVGIVAVPMAVHDVEPFSRVGVIKMQAVWPSSRKRRTVSGNGSRIQEANENDWRKKRLKAVQTQESHPSPQTENRRYGCEQS